MTTSRSYRHLHLNPLSEDLHHLLCTLIHLKNHFVVVADCFAWVECEEHLRGTAGGNDLRAEADLQGGCVGEQAV